MHLNYFNAIHLYFGFENTFSGNSLIFQQYYFEEWKKSDSNLKTDSYGEKMVMRNN